MKKYLLPIFSALMLSSLLLSGCCGKKTTRPITSGVWAAELSSINSSKASWQKPEQPVTLIVNDDLRYYGCAGINRYFGKAELDQNTGKLRFLPGGMTMMTGPGREYESAYLKMLESVDSCKICDDTLLLISKGTKVAVFKRKMLNDIEK